MCVRMWVCACVRVCIEYNSVVYGRYKCDNARACLPRENTAVAKHRIRLLFLLHTIETFEYSIYIQATIRSCIRLALKGKQLFSEI